MDLRQACFQDAAAAARTRALFASALARTLAARSETPGAPSGDSAAPALFRLRRLAFNLCDPTDLPDEAALLLLNEGMREEVALAAGLACAGAPLPAVMKGDEYQRWAQAFSPFAVQFAMSCPQPRRPPSGAAVTRASALEIGQVGVASWLASLTPASAAWTRVLCAAPGPAAVVDVRRAASLARLAWSAFGEERIRDRHS